jgi:hypothetical protein
MPAFNCQMADTIHSNPSCLTDLVLGPGPSSTSALDPTPHPRKRHVMSAPCRGECRLLAEGVEEVGLKASPGVCC